MFGGQLRRGLVLALLVACALATCGANDALAGIRDIAGVIVDANGVLRTKIFRDPSGALTRQRMAAARAAMNPELARASEFRKVSINRLEAALAERLANGELETTAMKYLAGLSRITHVFFYPETGDIVIAGPAEGFIEDISGRVVGIHSGRAILQLQDLIVALRAYPPSGDRTNVISVSIDPTPEGLSQMQQFLARVGGRATPADTQRLAKGLQQSLGLQTVSIRGVSPRSHFAQVLVEADYRMKLIGIGLEEPPVNIISYVARANPRSVSRNALQRWYFTPNYECVRVSEDEFAMELVGPRVKLVGEDELVVAGGARVKGASVDRASQLFVRSFTEHYDQLAERSPVYAQLRNLIDMSIVAAFIQQQDYYGQAGWQMELFGNEARLQVETYETPRQVETAVNAIWKGRTLMTPIGGGVNIQPREALRSERLLSDEEGELQSMRQQMSLDGLAKGRWWWD